MIRGTVPCIGSTQFFLCSSEECVVQFDADEVSVEIAAGFAGGPLAHAEIQDGVALVRIGLYEILQEIDRLARRVLGRLGFLAEDDTVPVAETDHVSRVACTVLGVVAVLEFSVEHTAVAGLFSDTSGIRHFDGKFLRVVCREPTVENTDVFVCTQRHFLRVQKPELLGLFPYNLVSEQLSIAADEVGGEGLGGKQDDGGVLSARLQQPPPTAFPDRDSGPTRHG